MLDVSVRPVGPWGFWFLLILCGVVPWIAWRTPQGQDSKQRTRVIHPATWLLTLVAAAALWMTQPGEHSIRSLAGQMDLGGVHPALLVCVSIAVLVGLRLWRYRARHAEHPTRTVQASKAGMDAAYYVRVLLSAAVSCGFGLFVARTERVALFAPAPPLGSALGWGTAALASLVLGMSPYWQYRAQHPEPSVQRLCPETRRDFALWTLVSLSAGIWEEIVYRGLVVVLLVRWTGSISLAVAVSVIAFTAVHRRENALSPVLIALIALVFHGLVFATGSLYVAMAVHFLYDVIAGARFAQLARKYGTLPAVPAPPA